MNHYELNLPDLEQKGYMPTSLPHEQTEHVNQRPLSKKLAAAGLIAVGAGVLYHNIPVLNSLGEHKTTIEPNENIVSISIADDARLRENPAVEDIGDSNLIDVIDSPIDVTTAEGVRVLSGTVDGTWYGVNSTDLAAAIPNFDDHGDADGVVWINDKTTNAHHKK